MNRLLAKSLPKTGEPQAGHYLVGHTLAVMKAGAALCDVVGPTALTAMGLPQEQLETLRRLVLAATWAHDLGKCSSHFQTMVKNPKERHFQLRRHETLSALILSRPGPLSDWFCQVVPDESERNCILSAAASHHRKFPRSVGDQGADPDLTLLMGPAHNFEHVLKLAWTRFGFTTVEFNQGLVDITLREQALGELSFDLDCDLASPTHPLMSLVRTIVICADVLGSAQIDAITSEDKCAATWLRNVMSRRIQASDLDIMVAKRGVTLRPFQEAVGASNSPVTLVRAGCGSGKTIAALLWAKQHEGRQIWFTYPTTGTAYEGFAGYGLGTEIHTTLEHSRRDVDLDRLISKVGEVEVLGTAEEGEDVRLRIESLRLLGEAVVFSTADVPLGWLQLNRKGTYAGPSIVGSAIVFDEIHSYDDRMFEMLLKWISLFPGIPLLLMTASLPAHRLNILRSVVFKTHQANLNIVDGPADLEDAPRYSYDRDCDLDAVLKNAADESLRVLWVSNTVDRCLGAARTARSFSDNVYIYHSRFKYVDRVERHSEVVRAFDPGSKGCVACTTQVAEMSLDLDADILIMDLSPVSSMIQRMGRLNRFGVPSEPKPFYVLTDAHHLPYSKEELREGWNWLQSLGVVPLSRRRLVDAWTAIQSPTQIKMPPIVMLEVQGMAHPDSVRDVGITRQVILDYDKDRVLRSEVKIASVLIPMNITDGSEQILAKATKFKYIPVVSLSELQYDPKEGARWLV